MRPSRFQIGSNQRADMLAELREASSLDLAGLNPRRKLFQTATSSGYVVRFEQLEKRGGRRPGRVFAGHDPLGNSRQQRGHGWRLDTPFLSYQFDQFVASF